MTDTSKTWTKIERYLEEQRPGRYASLEPGATASQISALGKSVGRRIPKDLAGSMERHDGQRGEELWDLWQLLPASRIEQTWRVLSELTDDGEFDGYRTEHGSRVRKGWWRKGWIPFASDGCGDHLCVDLDPGPKGTKGQVIHFRHDDGRRTVEAKSFAVWLRRVARTLPSTGGDDSPGPVFVGRGAKRRGYRNAEAAQRLVLAGRWREGKQALEAFTNLGDTSATAALTYINASEGKWESILENVEPVFRDGDNFGFDVLQDLSAIAARAADHTNDWKQLKPLARLLGRYWKRNPLNDCLKLQRDVFNQPEQLSTREMKRNENSYREWIEDGDEGRPAFQLRDPQTRRAYDFAIVCGYHQWDVALRMIRHELPASTGSSTFSKVAKTIQWARTQKPQPISDAAAWKLLLQSLDLWTPVSTCQVLPVEWLTLEGVRDLMTPTRCRKTLALPRSRWLWDPACAA